MATIVIEAELQEELNQGTFLAMGRSGSSRRLPGYTVSVDGELDCIRDTIEEAKAVASHLLNRVFEGDAVIIIR